MPPVVAQNSAKLKNEHYLDHVDDDTTGDAVFEHSLEAVAPKAATIVVGGGASAFIDQLAGEVNVGEVLSRFRRESDALRRIGSVASRMGVESDD